MCRSYFLSAAINLAKPKAAVPCDRPIATAHYENIGASWFVWSELPNNSFGEANEWVGVDEVRWPVPVRKMLRIFRPAPGGGRVQVSTTWGREWRCLPVAGNCFARTSPVLRIAAA